MVAPQPFPVQQQNAAVPSAATPEFDAAAQPNAALTDTWTNIHPYIIFDGEITPSAATQNAYRYNFVWGTDKPAAWKAGNPAIITSFYVPFDGDFTMSRDLTWWKTNHPSWILYKCDHRTLANLGGDHNVPLDISNPAVVRWQMSTYAPVMQRGGYDALAEDIVDLQNASAGCGVFVNGVWQQRFSGQLVDDTWARAVVVWQQYAYHYLHSLAHPLLVAINNVPEYRPLNDPEQLALLQAMDIMNDESSFTNYGNSFANQGKVSQILAWMAYVQGIGRAWYDDDRWKTPTFTQQQLDWSISTYLLGKGHHSSVYVSHMPGLYGHLYWYPEYTAAVGSPCANFYTDSKHNGVFYRKYTHAFVAVNANPSTTYSLPLPQKTYTKSGGGTVTSPLVAGPSTGAVLMTSANGCS